MQYSKGRQLGRSAYKITDNPDDTPESVLQNQCEEWLRWNRIPFWRMPDHLGRYLQTTAPIQYRKIHSEYFKGKPDLTLLLPCGRYLNVELKSARGKLSQGQKKFAEKVDVYVISSFENFITLVETESNRGESCSDTLKTGHQCQKTTNH